MRRSTTKLVVFLIATAVLMAGVIGVVISLPGHPDQQTSAPLEFQLKSVVYAEVTPHFVALENGYYAEEGVQVRIEPGGPGIDPIQLVLAGEADVGLASYDQILVARQNGLPLVAIGEVTIRSSVGFICLTSSDITAPNDFVGRRVGVMPGTYKGTVYDALMARERIDRSRITEIPVQFNLTILFNGGVEVFPAFINYQPIIAEQAGYAVNVIDPADYGIRPGGNVFFTSEDTLIAKRAQLVAFLRAELRAIMDAQSLDSKEAVECVMKHNAQLDLDTEIQIWSATKAMLSPRDRATAGIMKLETWEQTAELLHGTRILNEIPTLDDCYSNKLVEDAHKRGI